MHDKSFLTKMLALTGTVAVWCPILAPVVLSLVVSIRAGGFLLDYLMPAELFPLVLAGGGLLVWAALRARSRRRPIFWGLGISVVLLMGGQMLAVITGLASGEIEAAGWQWGLVLVTLAGYTLAVVVVGVSGVLLTRDLFKPAR